MMKHVEIASCDECCCYTTATHYCQYTIILHKSQICTILVDSLVPTTSNEEKEEDDYSTIHLFLNFKH